MNIDFSTLFLNQIAELISNSNIKANKAPNFGLKEYIRRKFVYPNYVAKWQIQDILRKLTTVDILSHLKELSIVYEILDDQESKELFLTLVKNRMLGSQYIKLPLDNEKYFGKIIETEGLICQKNEEIKIAFLNWVLNQFDLKKIGYDISLFYRAEGVLIDFILEQYAYREKEINICAKEGDYVIDAGGCWGDTALYFASKVKENGKVFSFEFIPQNIEIFKRNIELNPNYKENIRLIERPLWNSINKNVYYIDDGPGSKVSLEKISEYDSVTKTLTIDSFVKDDKIEKIDFIKMDIEGAELFALNGAIETIKKFKPTLAITIYHSLNDFVNIPKWIYDLNLGYKLYLGHYTNHLGETVIFAEQG